MPRFFRGIGRFGTAAPKRVRAGEIALDDGKLTIAGDEYGLGDVFYATVNVDPNPNNGVAGAIELKTKILDDFDGAVLSAHKYVILGTDAQPVKKLIEQLQQAAIEVDSVSVSHQLFSESFLGAPHVRELATH
ncbi:hypothetical protein LPB140_10320 [Sphingorhabdus lutea]|uniref:Uncharacterized protein n=1 Tax=Sphingorhabdus lutea TaxID=1913578 RepID=A0A1L3JDB4_9SPHN|nr:hypothetical protein [Sphingorhabdus lutea]APG63112.1 hypothetical protein LPB140_10320 [Sphingorhabdus lutea]